MANNSVAITLTIDEANALKAWTSQNNAVEKLKKQVAGLKGPDNPLSGLQAGADRALGTFKDMAIQITGVTGAIAGVMALANKLKAEWENLKAIQNNAAGTQTGAADALFGAAINMGGSLSLNEIKIRASRMGERLNQSPVRLLKSISAAGSALSPQGEEEGRKVLDTVEATNAVFPLADEQTGAALTKGAAGIQSAFGVNPQEAVGAIVAMAQNSAVTRDTDLAANILPSILSVASIGGTKDKPLTSTYAEAAGLLGAITTLSRDDTGETSRTTANTFGVELEKRLGNVATGPVAQIKYLQANPEIEKKFWAGGEFQGKKFGEPAVGFAKNESMLKSLTKSGSNAAGTLDKAIMGIGGKNEWAAALAELQQTIDANPLIQLEREKRSGDVTKELLELNNAVGARVAVARDHLAKTSMALGESSISQTMKNLRFEAMTASGTVEAGAEVLAQMETRISELESPGAVITTSPGMGPTMTTDNRKSPQQLAEDRKKAAILRSGRNNFAKAMEDYKRAEIAESATVGMVNSKDAVSAFAADTTKTPAEAKAVLKTIQESRDSIETYAKDKRGSEGPKMLEAFQALEKRMGDLIKAMEKNTTVTDDNTKTLPSPKNTPTPRPMNVSSLQNKRN